LGTWIWSTSHCLWHNNVLPIRTLKNPISNINRDFENRVRLGIMSILMVNEWVEFKTFKELLQVTDGNLSSHASALEKKNLLEIQKEFVSKKPRTSYRATSVGKQAFKMHLNALESLLKSQKQ
jgi:DNA-binding HxlR family transcriptional regulator